MLHMQVAGDPHLGSISQATLPHYGICPCFPSRENNNEIMKVRAAFLTLTVQVEACQLSAMLGFPPEDLVPLVALFTFRVASGLWLTCQSQVLIHQVVQTQESV